LQYFCGCLKTKTAMNDILMTPIRLNELDTLIQNSLRKVLAETNSTALSPDNDELLTVDEAAKFLKVTRPTIYGYLYNKQIPNLKKRGRVYFKKSELIAWLQTGSRQTRKETTESAAKSLEQQQ